MVRVLPTARSAAASTCAMIVHASEFMLSLRNPVHVCASGGVARPLHSSGRYCSSYSIIAG